MSEMLSELVHLQFFAKDKLAAMSLEELESGLERAKCQIVEHQERQRRNEEAGIFVWENSICRLPYMAKTFYQIELDLRKRRALNEDRLTLLKALRTVLRELRKDDPEHPRFPDNKEVVLDELLRERGGPTLIARRRQRMIEQLEDDSFC